MPTPRAGPRRSALDSVQRVGGGSASAVRRAQQRYTARCHVYDICQTLEASMRHPRPGAAYNIADDDPADRATVMAFAAELLERRAAGLPLQAAAGDGPGGWAVPVSSMSAAESGASSSGSYDSGDDGGLLSAALRPRERGAGSGRMRRSDARQAAAAAAAVREALAEKRVSWCLWTWDDGLLCWDGRLLCRTLSWTLVMLVGLQQPALHRAVWIVSAAAVVAEWLD